MSILFLTIERDHARIAVDTATLFPSGVVHETSKVSTLQHLNVALVSRGTEDLVRHLLPRIDNAPTFQELLARIADQLPSVLDHVVALEARMTTPPPPGFGVVASGQELVVIGWSSCHERMVAIRFYKDAENREFLWHEITDYFAHPLEEPHRSSYVAQLAAGWRPAGDAEFMQFARAQCDSLSSVSRKAAEPLIWGGRLLLTELTKDATVTRSLGALPGPALADAEVSR